MPLDSGQAESFLSSILLRRGKIGKGAINNIASFLPAPDFKLCSVPLTRSKSYWQIALRPAGVGLCENRVEQE